MIDFLRRLVPDWRKGALIDTFYRVARLTGLAQVIGLVYDHPAKWVRLIHFLRRAQVGPPGYLLTDEGFVVSTEDKDVGLRLYVLGNTERAKFDEVRGLTGRDRFESMIDVGANIGTSAFAALESGLVDTVVAIEPEEGNVRLLRANALLRGLESRIEVISKAAADRIGMVDLELSPTESGDHRVRLHADAAGPSLRGEQHRLVRTVPTVTLDSIDYRGASVLLHLDIQGFEGHALRGAQEMLTRLHPPIITEFWPYGMARCDGFDMFLNAIAAYGRIYDLRRHALLEQDELRALYERSRGSLWFTDLLVAE